MSMIIANAALEAAEQYNEILNGLVERATKDTGTPFGTEEIKALANLKITNPAQFESLRYQLKKVFVRVTQLDKAIATELGEDGGGHSSQTDVLLELAKDAVFFRAPDGTGYADIMMNEHRETWPIRSKGFKRWLTRQYYEKSKGAPGSEALQAALNALEAKAHFDGEEREVYIRIAHYEGKIYLDLCNAKWQVIEISTEGWAIIDAPPVRFRRSAGMLPLPIPDHSGLIDNLRAFLNVKTDDDFVLVVAWLLVALLGGSSYFLLILNGEQGTAKTTFARFLRLLVDPNSAALRSLPRDERDLFIAATNGYVLAFDNVSYLADWLSDGLCRIATGGAFATRQLFSDNDETLLDAKRPVILNGISGNMASRGDLADRAITLSLEVIPDDRRLLEAELMANFERERPRILGALLNAVTHGLKELPNTKLDNLPRMADCALWAAACETALWQAGTFMKAYTGNRNDMVETVIEADLVASSIRSFMKGIKEWKGTATELLAALNFTVDESTQKKPGWPSTAKVLSDRLKRVAPALRKMGIDITNTREGNDRTRTINISSSAASAPHSKAGHRNDISCDQADEAALKNTQPVSAAPEHKPYNNSDLTEADATDEENTNQSNPEEGVVPTWRARV